MGIQLTTQSQDGHLAVKDLGITNILPQEWLSVSRIALQLINLLRK
jgi:hypothetical protein